MPLEMWIKMIDINLTAVFLCCKWEAKVMIHQGYGKIINTARYISCQNCERFNSLAHSMSGSIVNVPQKQSHYNTSKAGVM
mgnify:CR=1 FL=1